MLVLRQPQPTQANPTRIELGNGLYATVDPEDFDWLRRKRWFAKRSSSRWYAVRKIRYRGQEHLIRMHREIMNCPPSKVVHHLNRNTLDNRKCNLVNMSPEQHYFAQRTW